MKVIRQQVGFCIVDLHNGERGAVSLGGTFYLTAFDWPVIKLHYRRDLVGD